MQKNEKSKKERLKKLHMILDRPSRGDLHPEDEKYLQALGKRLESSSKESIIYIHRTSEEKREKEADLLKPRVTIHHKEEKESVALVEQEELEGRKESLFEDENLYEVDKVEVKGPEFLEIKPKEISKEEKPESETSDKKKYTEDMKHQEPPEWEPVDIKKTETKVEETKEGKSESKNELPPSVEEKTEFKEEEFSPDAQKAIFLTPDSSVPDVERDSKIDVFRDIESIDEKTAVLLYDNGFTSIDAVKKASLKDLTRINGVKRKLAKRIKKEIDEIVKKNEGNIDYHAVEENNPFIEEDVDEWDSYEEDEIPKQKVKEVKGYRHGDYTLYKKEIETSSGKKRTVHFFSKAEPDEGVSVESPAGFEVKVNKKTGVPYLRKKSKKK